MSLTRKRAEAIRDTAQTVSDNAEELIEMFESPSDFEREDKEDATDKLESSIRTALKEWGDIE